jgi:5-methylcytosine-specific restriction endonuclease McrA
MINYLKQYITFGRFEIDEVLPFINDNKRDRRIYRVESTSFKVRMDSTRYKIFANNLHCSTCNIKGSFFLLQRIIDKSANIDTAHFNLYAEDLLNTNNGNIILMTQDHITPKSKGGKDLLSNLRTMCSYCNCKRNNKLI